MLIARVILIAGKKERKKEREENNGKELQCERKYGAARGAIGEIRRGFWGAGFGDLAMAALWLLACSPASPLPPLRPGAGWRKKGEKEREQEGILFVLLIFFLSLPLYFPFVYKCAFIFAFKFFCGVFYESFLLQGR
jgi:hypothetical protein